MRDSVDVSEVSKGYYLDSVMQGNHTSLEDFILEGLFDDSLTHLFLFSLTIVVFLIAVSANTVTIPLICADPWLHMTMYFLLSQLSLMDLMHVSTTIPKMATNYLSGKKSISFVGCATQHFLYLSVGSAECLLLALMSYDCYVAICHPLRYTVLMNRKLGVMMAVISWLEASMNSLIHTVILMHLPFCTMMSSESLVSIPKDHPSLKQRILSTVSISQVHATIDSYGIIGFGYDMTVIKF
ncbi:olfactory receptor 2AE1 [Trichechus manatus latirostris]|uniref:Olfactory receptor 2AE1 n=1 Tax=Trichechus manatus latirostris TaxID=127582 RepID=A0A2Y9RNV3_TRIMA|nr:olfactory receptor 2AE1 [Trichechus manatus latirostris]